MTPLPQPSSVTDPTLDEEPLVCPGCGYDLRAAPAGGRCSECGRLVDEVELRTSGFPWAHRHERGRVRTYLRTVWLVTAGSRRLAHEASRPQKLGDARAFRWVTAAVVGVALLGAFGLAVTWGGGLTFLAAQPVEPGGMGDSRWIQDVIIPWCAGATMWPVIPVALVGWTVYVTGVQRRLFWPKDASAAQMDRAQAVAHYVVAPLAFIFPAVFWAVVVALLVQSGTIRARRLDDFLWAT